VKLQQRIAVRTLVETVLRAGDLEMVFMNPARPLEGIRIHQKIQQSRPAGYQAEVSVNHEVKTEKIDLVIGGRIDGVFTTDDGAIVEEIKSTTRDPAALEAWDNPVHWGQVKVYAYFYALAHDLGALTTQLTYCHVDSGEIIEKQEHFLRTELAEFFDDVLNRYMQWAETVGDWMLARDFSIRELEFPFESYRPGQRQMAVAVYRAIRDGEQLMTEAATGIGKTMAALFPAIKAQPDGWAGKIFYLSARTTGKAAAEQAIGELRRKGLKLKSITLTAKDKICFCPEAACTAAECEFAQGFYDRINAALGDIFQHDLFDRDAIEHTAEAHRICPFEFSLELSLWSDCIVCDYNYAFDPRVYLRRFFVEANEDYVFLVDEAHNLPDRARDMFSARITKQPFLDVRRQLKDELPNLYSLLGRINTRLVKARNTCRENGGEWVEKEPPNGLYALLRKFLQGAEKWLAQNVKTPFRQDLLDLYFEGNNFVRVFDQFNDTYAVCHETDHKDLSVKLFCMDPSLQMREALTRCRSAVFFSATLRPPNYYQKLSGCSDDMRHVVIPSPFPRDNLSLLLANGISTLYNRRNDTKVAVARAILELVRQKQGNYLIFFPSYAYMAMVYELVEPNATDVDLRCQIPDMPESERDRFLSEFTVGRQDTLVGFVVMGGIFGEGIDLTGDRLTGAAIVGVGLPGICSERELIREYFDESLNAGFDYAYRFPGLARVFQAAGRVIRSEHDRGVVLLIDERFGTYRYRQLFPPHWQPITLRGERAVERNLHKFWMNVGK
jgi:DNA excision repair protein ERCC-2